MMTIGNLMCEISMLRSLLITRVQSARRAAVHHGDGAPWFCQPPATHSILTVLKAGETVVQADKLNHSKIHYELPKTLPDFSPPGLHVYSVRV